MASAQGDETRETSVEVKETTAVIANERTLGGMPEAFRLAFKKELATDRLQELWRDMVNSPSSRSGQWEAWVLVKRGDEDAQDQPLSYAGWLKRPCLVRSPRGDITEESFRAWVPVLTPDQHQGHGYAKHLMRLMHHIVAPPETLEPFPMDAWGSPPPALQTRSPSTSQEPIVGTLLSSIVPQKVYENVTVRSASGEEKGFVFATEGERTNDLLVIPVNVSPSSGGAKPEAQIAQHDGDWGLEWVRQAEMDEYYPSISHAAVEAIRHPAQSDTDKTIVQVMPVRGQVWHLDHLFRVVIPQDRPLTPGEVISGFRLFPRARTTADHKFPKHEVGWPICLFFEDHKTIDVLHQSGFKDDAAVSILLQTLNKVAVERGAKHVHMIGLRTGDPVRTAALSHGGTEMHTKSYPPDPMPPVGHCTFVEGEAVWRGIEYYNFP